MHLALARKYRPQNFDEVLGQGAVLTALKNAVSGARLHHAYLFCGARGVGKTSLARILAKSINCTQGPTLTPCQKCVACESITRGNSMDVMEIDGASNNSVDNVRELREQVKYLPTEGRYKIFIIDEVHMLSGAAFNALLKTLEEPPAHIIFIFATTEPHDLPVTILSRCQKYDFRKMSGEQLVSHMQSLLARETVQAEEGALRLIARAAQGSVRDALSLLDQAIGYVSGLLTEKCVREVLGLGERVLVEEMFAALVKADVHAALKSVAEADTCGLDLKLFAEEVLICYRHLILFQATGDVPPELSPAEAEFIKGLAGEQDASLILSQYQILVTAVGEIARSDYQKTVLEIACIKLVQAGSMMGLADVVAQLLEKQSGREAPPRGQTTPRIGSTPQTERPENVVAPVLSGTGTTSAPAQDWYALAKWIGTQSPAIGGALRQAVPVHFSPGKIEIAYDAKATSREVIIERRQIINEMMNAHFGRPVEFVVSALDAEKKKS